MKRDDAGSRELSRALRTSYWREAEARTVLDAWSESGLSIGSFAERHGIAASRLLHWRKRLGEEAARSRASGWTPHRGQVGVRCVRPSSSRRDGGVLALLNLPSTVRVYVAAEPVDLRRGFDGLAAATRQIISADPLSGHLFVFLNRRSDRVTFCPPQWMPGSRSVFVSCRTAKLRSRRAMTSRTPI